MKRKEIKRPKKKFGATKIGKLLASFGKGVAKEAVSYIPVVGDDLANKIEGALSPIASEKLEKASQIAGKVLLGGLILLLVFGKIDMEMFDKLFYYVRNF